MSSLLSWLKRFIPHAMTPRQLLDYYVDHPEAVYDAFGIRWLDDSLIMQIKEALDSLPDPAAYLNSLPHLRGYRGHKQLEVNSRRAAHEWYLDYLRAKADQNAKEKYPVRYAATQRIIALFRRPRVRRPLTPEEQKQFDSDWSLLSEDQIREVRQCSYNIIETQERLSSMTSRELYNTFHDWLNYTQYYPRNTTERISASDMLIYLSSMLLTPVEYWRRANRDRIDQYLIAVTKDQLANWMVSELRLNPNNLRSMTKRELIRYYNTLVISCYNQLRERNLRELRRAMEQGVLNGSRINYTDYLSLDDLTRLLDEFSIEHPTIMTKDTALDLIESYFDLYRPIELQISSTPIAKRKQP